MSERELMIETPLVERVYVTEAALAMVSDSPETQEDALIILFKHHNGSLFGDELFPGDANPQVGSQVLEVDPDA
jgi:hypothetical protein